MADNGLMVTVSGAALSLLFYENVRSIGDQMGFFLGEVLSFVTKNVTDSERQVVSMKTHVDIQSIIKCSPLDQIYEASGRINGEKLKNIVKDKGKRIVGWFRFRRDSSLLMSMKDKILHKQFLTFFHGSSNQINENCFVACMLNSSTSVTMGTHKFKHVFLHYKQGVYQPIPLRISNLGDDAARRDGSDYKPTPVEYSKEPDAFTKLINTLNLDLAHTPGVESVKIIQKAAEQLLEKLVPKVVDSDREVAELEQTVMELRSKFFKHVMRKHEMDMRDNYASEVKNRGKKETESSEQRIKFFNKNEESTSKVSKVQDDSYLSTKQSSITDRSKNRHSLPVGASITSNTLGKQPFERASYSQITRKTPERGIEDNTDC